MKYSEVLEQYPQLMPLLAQMPESIRENFWLKKYAANSIVHETDTNLRAFGILCKGTCRLFNASETGNVFILKNSVAVSFIGEVALLAEHERPSVCIETISACEVLYLPREDFYYWVKNDIEFLYTLCSRVARDIYKDSAERGERHYYPTRHLVLKHLIHYYMQNQQEGQSSVVVKETRQKLSETMGINLKTLNRTIFALRDLNLFSIRKGKISISPTQLERMEEEVRFYITQRKA